MLYFACGVGFLDSTSTTVMRSMVISVVPVTEIGKVFSVLEFFKSILSISGPIIYGKLYENTLRTEPAAYLLLSGACKVLGFIVGIMIYIQLGKREKNKKKETYAHKKHDTPISYEDAEEPKKITNPDTFVIKERETPPPMYDDIDTTINKSKSDRNEV